MDSFSFRPVLDGLEDRHVPSTVTPQQVLVAYDTTISSTDTLRGILDTLPHARTTQAIQNIQTLLPLIQSAMRTDVIVLNEFLGDIKAQLAANPSLAGTLDPLAAKVQHTIVEAQVNEAYANLLGPGFGVVPPVPPPPPPPTDTPPNFGTSPPPPASGLPFSLTDPGFQTIANGVRTMDVTTGTGAALQSGGQFTAKYTGFLTDGTVFDSSDKSGNLSTTADSAHLIPGFAAGVVGMQVGGERRIDIPASQAYGASPPPGSGIPANSELVFDVTRIA